MIIYKTTHAPNSFKQFSNSKRDGNHAANRQGQTKQNEHTLLEKDIGERRGNGILGIGQHDIDGLSIFVYETVLIGQLFVQGNGVMDMGRERSCRGGGGHIFRGIFHFFLLE